MELTVTYYNGMVNIDSDDISYATIKDMYTTGNGEGLQLNVEKLRPEATKMCRAISAAVFAFAQEVGI